jgi:hypothetical protein
MNKSLKISCPHCSWEPDGKKRWDCHCGFIWNTFDTFGKCPACGFVHKYTECLFCSVFSKHIDWYKIPSDFLLGIEKAVGNPEKVKKEN